MTTPAHDELLPELRLLYDKMATAAVLIECPVLLGALPAQLVRPDATRTRRAQIAYQVLRAVVDRAYNARKAEPQDVLAGRIMAVGAMFGIVTEPPAQPLRSLDEMTPKTGDQKEVRQGTAGLWLVFPLEPRGVRRQRDRMLDAFHDALQEWLQDEEAVEDLARRLDTRAVVPARAAEQSLARTTTAEAPQQVPSDVAARADGTNAADRADHRPRLSKRAVRFIGAGVIFVAAAGVVIGLVVSSSDHQGRHVGGSTSNQTTSGGSPTSAAATPMLIFDNLGSTASAIIRVYPGVKAIARDKVADGTFNSGDTVPAICKTTGRTVTSDPSYGEQPKHSDVWIKIAGTPGRTQYATLTYARVSERDLNALPQCVDVP